MATSHYCNGKWREGSVASCDRHTKLSKKQTNVYRGVGDPGGRSKTSKSSKPAKPKKAAEPTKATKPDKPASSPGASSSDG